MIGGMNKKKLIIDCDTGTDDAVALMLAALHPEIDLIGVSTVFGNAPLTATTINSISVLDLIGRSDIPVHAGLPRPLVRKTMPAERFFKADSVQDPHGTYLDIPRSTRAAASNRAVEWLIETYRTATEPITLMPIGPLTNIAAAVAQEPKFAEWVPQLIIMGGGHEVGNMTPSAEFNIWADPEAAASVFDE
jgi:purine nucleosidase/ribosylpyrimidine nucleosidase